MIQDVNYHYFLFVISFHTCQCNWKAVQNFAYQAFQKFQVLVLCIKMASRLSDETKKVLQTKTNVSNVWKVVTTALTLIRKRYAFIVRMDLN